MKTMGRGVKSSLEETSEDPKIRTIAIILPARTPLVTASAQEIRQLDPGQHGQIISDRPADFVMYRFENLLRVVMPTLE